MKKAVPFTFLALAFLASHVFGQSASDQRATAAETAAYQRRMEVLCHPSGAITIRLAALGREPATTPPPYTEYDRMHFQMFESQNSGDDLMCWDDRNPYYAYRPELIRDGDILSYTKRAKEFVARAEREPAGDGFSRAPETMISGREYPSRYVQLEDWYETPLKTGHYQLIVRRQFLLGGDWVESNPVTFDVVPRKPPTPIPEAFRLRLVPGDVKTKSQDQSYKLSYEAGLAVELINDSEQRVQIIVIDKYYGNRPQLTKDGQIIPYSDETTKLIESKEKDPRLVEVAANLYLDPKTNARPDGFSLKQWYAPLAPGTYHLTDRRRFEIGGPWTKDSIELVFEIVP
jgi:hypothetical protein